jgi:hypothetical protein
MEKEATEVTEAIGIPTLDGVSGQFLFAVRTDIETTTIGTWLKQLVEECREYGVSMKNRVLTATGDKRITPRGRVSKQQKPKPGGKTVKTKKSSGSSSETGRFLTISREIKGLFCSLISYMYTEVLMAVTYLDHRANELRDLRVLTSKIEEMFKNRDKINPEELHSKLHVWNKSFQHCVRRDPLLFAKLATRLDDTSLMIETKSHSRLMDNFAILSNDLSQAQVELPKARAFSIVDIADVILLKQTDFEYPFGVSLIEILEARKELGQGYPRMAEIIDSVKIHRTTSGITSLYLTIRERIATDIRNNLLPALRGINDIVERTIEISSTFVSSFADLTANFILDLAISCFNYAIAFTDYKTGTTIQLRAIKMILSQWYSTSLFPFPEPLINMICDLTQHSALYGQDKR